MTIKFKYDLLRSDDIQEWEGSKTKRLLMLSIIAIALIGMATSANYMYEKASVKV